jgi:hypothetical protein
VPHRIIFEVLAKKTGLCMVMLCLAVMSPSASYALPQHFELYGVKTPEQLEVVKAWGFNQVILESNDLIPVANDLGMRVVQANWWNPSTPFAQVEAQVQRAKVADQLVSVNMMDEPIYNDPKIHPPEYYVDLREKLLPHGVPLSLTQYGPIEEWDEAQTALFVAYLHAVDIMRIDPYPVVARRPLRTVFDWARRTLQMMEQEIGRVLPLTVILQAWADENDEHGRPKLPTPEELRVMMWLAFFSGADTISFYNYDLAVWDRDPGFQEALLKYVQELSDLRTQLVGSEIAAGFESQSVFRVVARDKGSVFYCLRVNTARESFGGLPGLGFSGGFSGDFSGCAP